MNTHTAQALQSLAWIVGVIAAIVLVAAIHQPAADTQHSPSPTLSPHARP